MSGGKGGSQTTTVEIPQWLEDAARKNIARGEGVATIGYVPYYGPEVAAFTPMQDAAFANANAAASAYGLAPPTGTGMPAATTFNGGVRGYSSGGLYDQAVAELMARRPGQYNAITGMFIDPRTGQQPAAPYGPGPLIGAAADLATRLQGGYGMAPAGPPPSSSRDDGRDAFDLAPSRPRIVEPIIVTAHDSLAKDAWASLTDSSYDPPGTVLSRALGGPRDAGPAQPASGAKSGRVQAPPPRPADLKAQASKPKSNEGSSMGSGK